MLGLEQGTVFIQDLREIQRPEEIIPNLATARWPVVLRLPYGLLFITDKMNYAAIEREELRQTGRL